MSLDPAFLELRTKPLPTLPERRRFIREYLVKAQGKLDRLLRLAAAGTFGTPKARKEVKRQARQAAWEAYQLTEALRYLGEPDERLDLYRLFGMDLPPEPSKSQPPLPLRAPRPPPGE
jgi:hypothetical protein